MVDVTQFIKMVSDTVTRYPEYCLLWALVVTFICLRLWGKK